MRCGLFGKLSAKRDFIALATPRAFLEIWEPWLQSCLSASQHQLGTNWQSAYLSAPLWRFWLGADISGETTLGAFMPSVDGIGRYYPLTLMAVADPSFSIPPPDLNAQDSWFSTCEEFLLSTLDHEKSFEQITATLDSLAVPHMEATASGTGDVLRISDTTIGSFTAGTSFRDALAKVRQKNHGALAAASFWWTDGGGDFPPMALACRGLLDPFGYSAMLTGRISVRADGCA
ncbi:type VI secretion system-associated protein TagF [Bradyrhizobium jicamae]|uniref:Type VI secretion system-associated protein TagF n=1 Tax=Bradyrhizobium jicamae TaxID=280332 RepID=A0ABS5FVV7_9BRAD|nr:type VI secretion system-associated protein TagF [Bradyrhizobium jicamae]MBR0800709.1 type VI secretion system-associated protein TagF [Bradyrhizobium jicamae]MBR0936623.1 type VI secretion system-associated protein TagF [Bradyrhizobium jicamae]